MPTDKATAIVNVLQLLQKTAGGYWLCETKRMITLPENSEFFSCIFSGKTVHRVVIGYSQNNYRLFVFLVFCLGSSMICLCSRLSVPLSLLLLFQVYLGLTDVTKLELAQLHEVETIIIHPGWNLLTKVRRPHYKSLGQSISQDNNILDGHDIALIRLTREVTLSDTVWPACLPGGCSRWL